MEKNALDHFLSLLSLLAVVLLLNAACRSKQPATNTAVPIATSVPTVTAVTPDPLTPKIAMVPIVQPGATGVFMMGSSDNELKQQASLRKDSDYYTDDEQPLHQVTLNVPYAMGKYEITNEQYCSVMNWAIDRGYASVASGALTDASGQVEFLGLVTQAVTLKVQSGIVVDGKHLQPAAGRKDHPVNDVSWYGAVAFCNFLSEMSGLEPAYDLATWQWDSTKKGYRLPTEAEWEYAARGTTRSIYAWGDEIDIDYLSYGNTRPVGFFDGTSKDGFATRNNASPFGIMDMTGSVWEWVWDWYGRDYYGRSPTVDPLGPAEGDDRPPYQVNTATRVWRGGGWMAPIGWGYLRIAKRWSSAPAEWFSEVGFRIAQTQR